MDPVGSFVQKKAVCPHMSHFIWKVRKIYPLARQGSLMPTFQLTLRMGRGEDLSKG